MVINGENLITSFQCDNCHFRNLTGREPEMEIACDSVFRKIIRRAQLNAFWAIEPRIVARNLGELRKGVWL